MNSDAQTATVHSGPRREWSVPQLDRSCYGANPWTSLPASASLDSQQASHLQVGCFNIPYVDQTLKPTSFTLPLYPTIPGDLSGSLRNRQQLHRADQEWFPKTLTVTATIGLREDPWDTDTGLDQDTKTLLAIREEEMGRLQCKNLFSNLKSNKVTPQPSGHTGRPDHPNSEEAEKKP